MQAEIERVEKLIGGNKQNTINCILFVSTIEYILNSKSLFFGQMRQRYHPFWHSKRRGPATNF